MLKLYKKSELGFALLWIALYVVLLSVADSISMQLGTQKLVSAPMCIILTAVLYIGIKKSGLSKKYGLCRFEGEAKRYLYFIPLLLLASTNLWWGVKMNLSAQESVLYVISMLCVGFLEEVIFRGLLFEAMRKDDPKSAFWVSGVSFGLGHIINLLSGAELVPTLLQILYATAVGFLFTLIFYRGRSLWPCIITHSAVNSLSAFSNTQNEPKWGGAAAAVFMCALSLAYFAYIQKSTEK